MSKIVILGSSAGCVKLIEELRSNHANCDITLIAFDGHCPYNRDEFAQALMKTIPLDKVFCSSRDFYEKNNVNVVLDNKITRINFKRKKIFTDNKEQIEYDVLIVTDTPENRFPTIKGTGKNGVYGYKKINDIDQIVSRLPLIDTIAIQSKSITGLKVAAAITKRKKEVILVCSQDSFLNTCLNAEARQWFVNKLNDSGLKILNDDDITEILGEQDAKAIRIKSGKVFSAQIVIFGEMDEDLRMFSDSGLSLSSKISVNDQFRTNNESIFAIDQAARLGEAENNEPVTPLAVLEEQGKAVVAALNGQAYDIKVPVQSWDIDLEGLTISVIGKIGTNSNRNLHQTFDHQLGKYIGIYVENQCCVGAVLINADSEKGEYMKLISENGPFETLNLSNRLNDSQNRNESIEQSSNEDISTELVDN